MFTSKNQPTKTMTATLNINGTVAFVTGTNKANGIGRAIVDALLQHGAKKVYATARDASQLDELVESAEGRVVAVSLDVSNPDQVAKLGQQFPDVNLVVNNAGYSGNGSSLDENAAELAIKELQINYIAPLRVTQSFAGTLAENGNAGVVNLASIASLINFPGFSTYSASKAAAHSLTQAQRRDFGAKTLVVGVYPGPIDTDMAENVPFEKASPSAVAEAIIEALQTGTEDVFPDAMAVQLHQGWQADAKNMELLMAQPQSA